MEKADLVSCEIVFQKELDRYLTELRILHFALPCFVFQVELIRVLSGISFLGPFGILHRFFFYGNLSMLSETHVHS